MATRFSAIWVLDVLRLDMHDRLLISWKGLQSFLYIFKVSLRNGAEQKGKYLASPEQYTSFWPWPMPYPQIPIISMALNYTGMRFTKITEFILQLLESDSETVMLRLIIMRIESFSHVCRTRNSCSIFLSRNTEMVVNLVRMSPTM